jgi:hypothetical protein
VVEVDRPLEILLAFGREDERFVSPVQHLLQESSFATWSVYRDAGIVRPELSPRPQVLMERIEAPWRPS